MKNVLLILLVFQLSAPMMKGAMMLPDPNSSVFSASMLEVKKSARETNKPYLVQFTAKWCMPCRWMESTTYKDERVIDMIANNFLAVKVDIDDFDGYAWKEYYGVNVLPTLLVFSAQGKLLDKRDHSLSPSQLLGILKQISEEATVSSDAQESQQHKIPGLDDLVEDNPDNLRADLPLETDSHQNVDPHESYLQFGIFNEQQNALKCYEQVAKNITFPVRMDELKKDADQVTFVIRSEGITDPDTEMSRIVECDQKNINYLVKLERHDGQPDHSKYQKIVSRLGSNATL